jgi:hypothetical protein
MKTAMEIPAERYTKAVMFRAFLNAAARAGMRDAISRSSPELAQMFEKPPLPTAMVPGSICDKLYAAVDKAKGRAAVRALGYEGMRDEGARLLGRLFVNTIACYGNTPEALLGEIATIVDPIVSKIEVQYTPETLRSGFVDVRPAGRPAPLSYAVWEGYLEYFFEVAGVPGTVEQFVTAADGLSGRTRVHW